MLEQYLKHLEVLEELNLNDLGDFIVMASTLMEIKSRDLLPGEEIDLEDDFDPRDDLVRRLLEYKRFRDISLEFDRMAEQRSEKLPARVSVPAVTKDDDGPELDLGNVEIWSLTKVFARLLEETGTSGPMRVGVERRSVRYYTEHVLRTLQQRRELEFVDLFDKSEGRYGLIGVFAAVLELMKQGCLRAHQEECDGPIAVAYVGPDDVTVDALMAGALAQLEEDEAPA